MIRRLVEVHYFQHRADATPLQIEFWLKELRTAILLRDVAASHPATSARLAELRPILAQAVSVGIEELVAQLLQEELAENKRTASTGNP